MAERTVKLNVYLTLEYSGTIDFPIDGDETEDEAANYVHNEMSVDELVDMLGYPQVVDIDVEIVDE